MRKITTALLALLGVLAVSAYPEEDRMGNLPGTDPWTVNAFSGYLNVSSTKSLHYVFVESQRDPASDPLVIWFNGGPGCSSLIAFFQEHGPYVIDDGESYVKNNPYSWNTKANMIYLESPAGVGYSMALDDDALNHNDMTQS